MSIDKDSSQDRAAERERLEKAEKLKPQYLSMGGDPQKFEQWLKDEPCAQTYKRTSPIGENWVHPTYWATFSFQKEAAKDPYAGVEYQLRKLADAAENVHYNAPPAIYLIAGLLGSILVTLLFILIK